LATRTYSPVVDAIPTFTFSANVSGRGFSSVRTPVGISRIEPGRFPITSVSST